MSDQPERNQHPQQRSFNPPCNQTQLNARQQAANEFIVRFHYSLAIHIMTDSGLIFFILKLELSFFGRRIASDTPV